MKWLEGNIFMYCINDLRLIMSPETDIRVWSGEANPWYEGKLENLPFTHQAAKATVVCMKSFSGVLVFFVTPKK